MSECRDRAAQIGPYTAHAVNALLADAAERRFHKQLTVRVRRAGFHADKTLERFDFAFNPQINRAVVMDLATCQFIERKHSMLLVGPTGTGKTHLAQALGHEACRKGYDVMYANTARLLAQLAAAHVDGSFERRDVRMRSFQ